MFGCYVRNWFIPHRALLEKKKNTPFVDWRKTWWYWYTMEVFATEITGRTSPASWCFFLLSKNRYTITGTSPIQNNTSPFIPATRLSYKDKFLQLVYPIGEWRYTWATIIVFPDKAWFYLNGCADMHNNWYWSLKNPKFSWSTTPWPESWCLVWNHCKVNNLPYFFYGYSYLKSVYHLILNRFFPKITQECRVYCYFQQELAVNAASNFTIQQNTERTLLMKWLENILWR
jgi:hypothetical protein